jgi:hypothetical protein
MFKRLSGVLAGLALASTIATADYNFESQSSNVPMIEIGLGTVQKLSNLVLGSGLTFDTGSRISVAVNFDVSFAALIPSYAALTTQSPWVVQNFELGLHWFQKEDKVSGVFFSFFVGADIKKAEAKADSAVLVDVYLSGGIGHKFQLADWLSITNRVFVKQNVYEMGRSEIYGVSSKTSEDQAAEAAKNILALVRFELVKLEFCVY